MFLVLMDVSSTVTTRRRSSVSRETMTLRGSSELSEQGLRVEVEVLDDERTSTPAVVKDLDNVSPYLLLLRVA